MLCVFLLACLGANAQRFSSRLDFIVLIIFGERHKLQRSALCSFPHPLCQAKMFSLARCCQACRRDKENKIKSVDSKHQEIIEKCQVNFSLFDIGCTVHSYSV